jgi:hypothetical protein
MTKGQQGTVHADRPWLVAALAGLVLVGLVFAGVQAEAKKASGSLTTTFESNNSNAGISFDLDVLPRGGIDVKRLDANLQDEGSGPVQLWTRPGTAEGFVESAAGWTSRGSITVAPQGMDAPTPVPISFHLDQGSYGVVFGSPDGDPGVHYTDSGSPAFAEEFENNALRLTVGRGLDSPLLSLGSEGSPRLFNGTIYYRVPCEAAKKKLKKAKKQVKKAKRKLAAAIDAGDAQDIAVAQDKLEQKQKKLKKAKRKKKRACS